MWQQETLLLLCDTRTFPILLHVTRGSHVRYCHILFSAIAFFSSGNNKKVQHNKKSNPSSNLRVQYLNW